MNTTIASTPLLSPSDAQSALPSSPATASTAPVPSLLQGLRSDLREANRVETADSARKLFERWLGDSSALDTVPPMSPREARLHLLGLVWQRAFSVRTPWINVSAGILGQAEIGYLANGYPFEAAQSASKGS